MKNDDETVILNDENLISLIQKFGDTYLNETDIVVGILRYGAHIPHIYRNISQKPKHIHLLLSHMLSYFPPDFYQDKKFLLLDDTVFSGNEMCKLKSILEKEHRVPKENIHTAALVLHDQSEFVPDYFGIRLSDARYIAWKEILGSLVTQDSRPTDRDHPLYYFNIQKMDLGHFLDILENFGWVHSSGNSDSAIFKITLTLDANVIKEKISSPLPGIELGKIYKIRFYWKQELSSSSVKITMAPMGFPEINIDQFIKDKGGQILAKLVGLNENFFDDIYNSQKGNNCSQMLFYFASKSIAALVLSYFLEQVNNFCDLEIINPVSVDEPIIYKFPKVYEIFYETVFDRLKKRQKTGAYMLPLFRSWKKPERFTTPSQKDPLIPISYEVLNLLAKDINPAKWNGQRWIPNDIDKKGVSFQELLDEFKDPLFVSKALDELLDMGLLSAKDIEIKKGCFTRIFLRGGEYNAVQVSSIADTLNYDLDFTIDPKIIEEEALELWGPF